MNLDKFILELQKLRDQHGGDIEVTTFWIDGRVMSAPIPKIRNMLILKGRETKPGYYRESNGEDRKGEQVIEV